MIDTDEEDHLLLKSAFQQVNPTIDFRCFFEAASALDELDKVNLPSVPLLVLIDSALPDAEEIIEALQSPRYSDCLWIVVLGSEDYLKTTQHLWNLPVKALYSKPSRYNQLLDLARELVSIVELEKTNRH